jgi:hypothetical protein
VLVAESMRGRRECKHPGRARGRGESDLAKESGGRGGLSSLSVTPLLTEQTAGAAACVHRLVAIDQHEPVPLGDHHHRHLLPELGQRAGQSASALCVHDPRVAMTKVEMQIDLHDHEAAGLSRQDLSCLALPMPHDSDDSRKDCVAFHLHLVLHHLQGNPEAGAGDSSQVARSLAPPSLPRSPRATADLDRSPDSPHAIAGQRDTPRSRTCAVGHLPAPQAETSGDTLSTGPSFAQPASITDL